MLPRNLPDSVTKCSPDGKVTPTRTWNLKLVSYYQQNSGKEQKTINGDFLEGILLPTAITPRDILDLREKLQLRADDVFVVTYPKCGTTWMQQIVKLVWNNGVEDGRDVDEALPWIDPVKPADLEGLASPRGFKTHLPYHLCPGGDPSNSPAKYIYVYRNPKDAMVSNYHFTVKFLPDDISWDSYFDMLMSGGAYYGNIIEHMKGWYMHKDLPNILTISYEMLKKDPFPAISLVAKFLGYSLSDEVIAKIVELTSFEKMKGNSLANNSWLDQYRREGSAFMRKGIVGDWKTLFSDKQSARVDELIDKLQLSEIGLVFEYGH